MTLQAAIDAELPFLRAEAEARMTSRADVRRRTERWTQDDQSGEETPVWETVHTDLPFRIAGSASGDGGSHTVTIAGVEYQQATAVGHFPAATTDLEDSDFIDVTSGEWVGAAFSVVAATRADQKTARRVPIAEETRPSEWGA